MKQMIISLCVLITGILLPLSAAQTTDLIHVTRDNVQEVLQSPKPVVIDVYADWCGPCRKLAPIFQSLNDRLGDRYLFAKLDSGTEKAVSKQFQIKNLPTLIFIKEGKEVGRTVGFLNESQVMQKIHEYFET